MLYYNGKLNKCAKDFRKKMTPQERKLWYQFLRKHPKKFYKQKIIGNDIVDFYCHAAKLAIEIDGSQHYADEQQEYDEIRTSFLCAQGIKVIRFSNKDVDNNFDDVCREINQNLNI